MQFLQRKKWFCRGVLALSAAALSFGAGLSHGAQKLRLSTLGPGSAPYVVMTTFANIVNEHVPDYRIQVNATGVAPRHAIETAQGRSELFMTSPNLHALMVEERGPFVAAKGAGEMAKKLRGMFSFPIGIYHIVTNDDSGIFTLDQLKGKRVFLGPPGSVAYDTSKQIIEASTGLKVDTDMNTVKLGWDAASQSFQDGHVDVYFNPTLAPSPLITQFALTRKLRLLDIERERVPELLTKPGYRLTEIPNTVYGNALANKGSVRALLVTAGVATNVMLSEEAAYLMTKAFWEHLAVAAKSTPMLQSVRLENALDDMNMPLHPGAARYYREQGMTIPAALLAQ